MSCQIEIREDGDIPFITEIDEESASQKPSPSPRNTRESFRSNRTISPSSSTSSSFKCSAPLGMPNPFCQNAFLLNEIYDRRDSALSNGGFHHHCRRTSSRRSCQSQNKSRRHSGSTLSIGVKASSRRPSTRSRRESKFSYVSVGECGERRRSVHIPHSRRHGSTKRKVVSRQASLEQQAKSKRKRTIACIILGTFLFILFCSVMAVVVTLTHRSKIISENKTMTYYTFSPDAK
ncbi:hypothetical protein ILUMI_17804, partial [Ignelater luminosus]